MSSFGFRGLPLSLGACLVPDFKIIPDSFFDVCLLANFLCWLAVF
jgi:hypothetical protein